MRELRLNLEQKQSFITSLSAAVTAFLVLIMLMLLVFVLVKGSDYFWPQPALQIDYQDTKQNHSVFAQQTASTVRIDEKLLHFRVSNQQQVNNGQLTLSASAINSVSFPPDLATILLQDGSVVVAQVLSLSDSNNFDISLQDFDRVYSEALALKAEIELIRHGELAQIHIRLAEMDKTNVEQSAPARVKLAKRFYQLQDKLTVIQEQIDRYQMHIQFADNTQDFLYLIDVKHFMFTNQMSVGQKFVAACQAFWIFISESPKLNNTTGGVFPALFGTILMVLLMTLFVTPFGVFAAIYLHEYAPRNTITSLIRISVNNLAGVPSIVYGVFGLGFFVYTIGGSIDSLLFSQDLPSPTFGSPGLFWASLTMAILTLPVVIVATEEGLRRVPRALRDGSYALGATQAETIFKTVLPMASPGIMTGVILAIARGAGEVAPLMMVGAVKFAPALPVDTDFPFLHLERQFMHLGVLIYDGAFHSQNIGNGSSFMFACCMLLLLVVFGLNLIAVFIRNRLRNQYSQD